MTHPQFQPHPQAPYYPPSPPLVVAGWSDRFIAYLLDGVFLFVVYIIAAVVAAMVDPSESDESIIAPLVVVLVGALLNRVYLQCTTGQSIGKRVMGIKLLSERTGLPPGVARTIGRELLGFILGRIPLLGLVWGLSPLFDDLRRGWHDAALSTIVVKLPKY